MKQQFFTLCILLVPINVCKLFFSFPLFLQDGKTKFEQELYNNFAVTNSRPYFITFAGDVSPLSFALLTICKNANSQMFCLMCVVILVKLLLALARVCSGFVSHTLCFSLSLVRWDSTLPVKRKPSDFGVHSTNCSTGDRGKLVNVLFF